MNNSIIKLACLSIACTFLTACDPDFDNPVDDNSSLNNEAVDFSKFVSLGDSLTAGYADGALYLSGQQNSYPAILAQQFATVGGGTFTQPLMDDNLGGLLLGGEILPGFDNRLVMNTATGAPEPITGSAATQLHPALNQNILSGPFNNMGVPGAKSFHLFSPGYGLLSGIFNITTSLPVSPPSANPYYIRFATNTGASSMISEAAGQSPTFFVLWIGNNDILSYATKGGSGVDQTGNLTPTTYGSEDITDPAVFAGVFRSLVGALTTNSATKGVLVNIPDVSTIPYFTTVPFNPVPLDGATAAALNSAYAAYNGGLQQLSTAMTTEELASRTITFTAGQNAVVILDEDLTDLTGFNSALINMRQATAEDLLILTTSSKIGTLADPDNPSSAWGVGVPLEDGDVLIASEIAAINTARTAFNATIKAVADENTNLIFVDIAALMTEIQSGFDYATATGTGSINAVYATGGGFSLDGVHPTARGYAVVANTIIDAINSGFDTSILKVDPDDYSTIFFKATE